jgi:hypothetical protein
MTKQKAIEILTAQLSEAYRKILRAKTVKEIERCSKEADGIALKLRFAIEVKQ